MTKLWLGESYRIGAIFSMTKNAFAPYNACRKNYSAMTIQRIENRLRFEPTAPASEEQNLTARSVPTDSLSSCRQQATTSPGSVVKKILLSPAALVLYAFFLFLNSITWVSKKIKSEKQNDSIFQKFIEKTKKGDIEDWFSSLSEDDPSQFAIRQICQIPGLLDHVEEILSGANVCLKDDGGLFGNRWAQHKHARPRISSHSHRKGSSYELSHFAFWIDPEGNTRFQFQRSPFCGFKNKIHHSLDFLLHLMDGMQRGPLGKSERREANCLKMLPPSLSEEIRERTDPIFSPV